MRVWFFRIHLASSEVSNSALSVGKPYSPHITTWSEGPLCHFLGGHYELIVPMRHPNPAEIMAARKGDAEFALVYERGVIFLLYRFGNALPWSGRPVLAGCSRLTSARASRQH